MCAASASAPIPLYSEGQQYWQNLTDECQRLTVCVNATLEQNRVQPEALLQFVRGLDKLLISQSRLPSFNTEMTFDQRSWGPVIHITLYGQNGNGEKFLPQSLELPLATDGDGETVAIYEEGRSFSPQQVASFVIQYFHICHPGISFPC